MVKFSDILQPEFYIPKFLKIRTKDASLVPFIPKPPQLKLQAKIRELRDTGKPVRIIILKARQMGFSTYVEADVFVDTSTHKLKNSLIVAHEDTASQNLYTMYKTYFDNLPPELTPMTKYSNAQEMLFENPTNDIEQKRRNPGMQSSIKVASARNTNAGRSQTIHNLHASEVAFWNDPATLMTGLMQCVPDSSNTSVYIESTANGVGGWFYDFWNDAVNGRNEYTPMFFAWFEEPTYFKDFYTDEEREELISDIEYAYTDKDGNIVHTEEWELMHDYPDITLEQMNWRRYCIRNKCHGDLEKFHQEYPATPEEAFIASGRPRFAVGNLKKYLKNAVDGERGDIEKGQFIPNDKGYIEIFKKPEEDEFYCMGADVAEGLVTGDNSCAEVLNNDLDVVAVWHGHIDPDLFGKELVKLARYYNDAYMGVESNNHGRTTIKSVMDEDYYNIYFAKIYDKAADTVSQKVGWSTTSKTKPLMINKLAEYIREKWIGIKHKTTLKECLTYVIEDNGSTNAQQGCHDDTVMALAIALMVYLEGKGENFVPFVNGEKQTVIRRTVDNPSTLHSDCDLDSPERVELCI